MRTKHDPTKWPVPDTVPTPTAAPFNVQHPLGPPVMTAPISPAATPLANIPPPPMPRGFRSFPSSKQVFFDESGASSEKASENAPRSTFTENLNPDVPEFIPIVNGHEDSKRDAAASSSNVKVDECVEALEGKLTVEKCEKAVTNDSSKFQVRCIYTSFRARLEFSIRLLW